MIDLSNTRIAFADKSNKELNKAYWLFKLMNNNFLVKCTNKLALLCIKLRLPIAWFVKKTIFLHFCGGENIDDCKPAIQKLSRSNIKTILDYSVEGGKKENDFEETAGEIISIIQHADNNPDIASTSLKMTGIARLELLEKVHAGDPLSVTEQEEFNRIGKRLDKICNTANHLNVPIYIDAEESWIQNPIDELTMKMMKKYNKKKPIVSNTLQMYIRNKIKYLKACYALSKKEGFYLGVKFVRGAYWEKERERAAESGYPSPVYAIKEDTDNAFDEALTFSVEHIDKTAVCAATHNEKSSLHLAELIKKNKLDKKDPHVWFSQLMGMSDHITYNIAHAGFNVTKYVPYGPINKVLPYLIRRAEENSAISGQMGRELNMIQQEIKRRN